MCSIFILSTLELVLITWQTALMLILDIVEVIDVRFKVVEFTKPL